MILNPKGTLRAVKFSDISKTDASEKSRSKFYSGVVQLKHRHMRVLYDRLSGGRSRESRHLQKNCRGWVASRRDATHSQVRIKYANINI